MAIVTKQLKTVIFIVATALAIGYFTLFVIHNPHTGNLRADPSWHASEFYAINAMVNALENSPPQSRSLDALRRRKDLEAFMTDTSVVKLSQRPRSTATIEELNSSRLVISVTNVDDVGCPSYLLYGLEGGELTSSHGSFWVGLGNANAAVPATVFKSGGRLKNRQRLSIDQVSMACVRDAKIWVIFNFDQ